MHRDSMLPPLLRASPIMLYLSLPCKLAAMQPFSFLPYLSCAQCRRHQASMEPPEWVTLPYTLGSPPLVRHCTTQRPPSWAGPHKRI
eukprot:1157495-Pelagomonas_calceolata.AAC.2